MNDGSTVAIGADTEEAVKAAIHVVIFHLGPGWRTVATVTLLVEFCVNRHAAIGVVNVPMKFTELLAVGPPIALD